MIPKPNDGGPAFPVKGMPIDPDTYLNRPGMSLRAYYAGQALMGWAAGRNRSMCESDADKVADACVAYSDALIRKLGVKP